MCIDFFKSNQNFCASNLERTLLKVHKCNQCDYSAGWSQGLKEHKASVHEKIRRFECAHCEYQAYKRSNLKRHIENVHEGISYQCPKCKTTKTRKDRLKGHECNEN